MLKILFLILVFVGGFSFSFLDAFADPIYVTTDKISYVKGETIVVTGEVNEVSPNTITLTLSNPEGVVVQIGYLNEGSDKKFKYNFSTSGTFSQPSGEYKITAQYGSEDESSETTILTL